MGVSKNRGKTSKMDGWNNGKPYVLVDDLGGKKPYFWFNTHIDVTHFEKRKKLGNKHVFPMKHGNIPASHGYVNLPGRVCYICSVVALSHHHGKSHPDIPGCPFHVFEVVPTYGTLGTAVALHFTQEAWNLHFSIRFLKNGHNKNRVTTFGWYFWSGLFL